MGALLGPCGGPEPGGIWTEAPGGEASLKKP